MLQGFPRSLLLNLTRMKYAGILILSVLFVTELFGQDRLLIGGRLTQGITYMSTKPLQGGTLRLDGSFGYAPGLGLRLRKEVGNHVQGSAQCGHRGRAQGMGSEEHRSRACEDDL